MDRKLLFDVKGMHCASCSSSVEKTVISLSGVKTVSVSLINENMRVLFDEEKTGAEQIIKSVNDIGFRASLFDFNKNAEEEKNRIRAEFIKKRNRSLVSVFFALLVLLISAGHMHFPLPLPSFVSPEKNPINYAVLLFLLSLPVLYLSRRFFTSGFKALFHLMPNMDSLVALSATVSFVFSVCCSVLIFKDSSFVRMLYYESATSVLAFVSLGKLLEEHNRRKMKNLLSRTNRGAEKKVSLLSGGRIVETDREALETGDLILLKSGDAVPADCIVMRGSVYVNEETFTGESRPVLKKENERVFEGTYIASGSAEVAVEKYGNETEYSNILAIAREAQDSKIKIEKTADRICACFIPAVLLIAFVSSVVWFVSGATLFFSLRIFASVLVVACPCALGLGTPAAVLAATSLALKNGLLVRNPECFEKLPKITDVVFDKTGTLTYGKFDVVKVCPLDTNYSEREITNIASNLESISNHPVAFLLKKKMHQPLVLNKHKEVAGAGVEADIDGKKYRFGRADYVSRKPSVAETEGGQTASFLSCDGEVVGYIVFADTLREDAAALVGVLKEKKLAVSLITGDESKSAECTAEMLGIENILSRQRPQDKLAYLDKLSKQGRKILMAGDGINDAPSLARSFVSIAPFSGTDVALSHSDIVLMNNKISDILKCFRLSECANGTIRRNLFFAFIYNVCFIPMAAGAFYRFAGLLLSPSLAGILMSLSSLSVIFSSLMLGRKKL